MGEAPLDSQTHAPTKFPVVSKGAEGQVCADPHRRQQKFLSDELLNNKHKGSYLNEQKFI